MTVVASVFHEPEDAELTVARECVQRHLGRQEGSELGPTGERDRRGSSVARDLLEEVAQLGKVCWVDLRHGGLKELVMLLAEERAAGPVGGEDPIILRVDHVGGFGRPLEELPERGRVFRGHLDLAADRS